MNRFPTFRYHPFQPARIFHTPDELNNLEPLWRDSPYSDEEIAVLSQAPPPAPPEPLSPPTTPDSLAAFTAEKAAPLIAQETRLEVVAQWRQLEERSGVQRMLDKRLDELTAPTPKT